MTALRPLLVLVLALGLLTGGSPSVSATPTGGGQVEQVEQDGQVVPAAGYGWPLAGDPVVTRPFDPPAHVYGPGHRGVDLSGVAGEPVLAAGAGVVAFAGSVAGRPVVSVDHPDGVRTTYEPVAPVVAAGQVVTRGSPLGVLQPGHTGCPADACLHWGARVGQTYLDPLALLTPPRVRLLPWG
ncbi:peptidoglycan DD-metalloendopeptidase family protein [Klenkia sp. LSe6-5]|uniref:Peptidoglycan DD-metalloendopeptidase family protein n=1 Tax=Klenkia sesuvii TaxID=3103137 RepID=A0ABU8DVP7_9ACTN